MYDITIIGAGPAGATLARLIGKDYKVLLLDKQPFGSAAVHGTSKIKCCGGLLAPDSQKMLAVFGLGLPQDLLVDPQLFAVRTIDLQSRLERYYQRFYINIDREKFDRWLVSLIPAAVERRFDCLFKSFHSTDDGLEIHYSQAGKEFFERTRILIGADGAASKVRRTAFPDRPAPKKYIAVQEWFQAEEALPYFTAVFDRAVTDYYSWTISKDNCLIVGSALPMRNETASRFELLKNKLRAYGFQLDRSLHKESAFISRPGSLRQICTGAGRVSLLGEAAGWISPSSAEGLSYALNSALLCAQGLKNGPEHFAADYARKTGRMRMKVLSKNLKASLIYHPLLRKIVMQWGISSITVEGAGLP